ncbi:alpha-mannosidase [Paenibacillus sp. SYP-B3998]|uniref:Alpha-mannosidase n=1 Tax=Paenibacillus sp. SYP-B3998 TaxID=2678564 RepID=A0A6G3ZRX0_9BACL|nr:glycoside hydrolase family 38 C-terminal domain-containing protein [Paenibacillus sp. SYP-B3998]NEW04800.1 alpha-mannosidase [Paenibacillus sp. SYP-B3998]
MPYEIIRVERLKQTLKKIEEHIYEPIASLSVKAYVTKEPVSYEEKTAGREIQLNPGDKWGELWDCAWFHFEGIVPPSAAESKIVLLLDINGELCLFDEEGTPLQGLTNVNSEFDLTLGLPGKRVVPIHSQAAGGEIIDLWGDAGCNDLFGYYRSGTLKEALIAVCAEETRQLFYDYEVLLELAEHLEANSARKERILQTLYDAHLLLVDLSAETVAKARELLDEQLSKQGGDATLSVSAIGHAHIDLAWLWPIRETKRKGARTFATVLRLMEQYPDYVFGASQPQLYAWMKEEHPKLYEQIKQRVAEGRWEVQGGMWVEPDSNISGGEALVRQILYGKRFFLEEFGKDMKILWVPDIFGYSACLPQLLQKSGMTYMMTQKLSWSVYNDHPHHTFFWEGLDGSQVLTHLPPEDTYNGPAAPRSVLKAERGYTDKNVSDHCLLLFGIGDGGGGPGEEHLERLKREKNLQGLAPVQQEPALQFFDKLAAKSERYKRWKGELYLEKHQGTLTSQARNKSYNRKMEKALRELEFAAALHTASGGDYPSDELDEIWKEVLLYQFHDILPGSSIKRVYDESLARYEILLFRVQEMIQTYYEQAANKIDTTGEKQPVVVFNSLPWERKEWLQVNGHWIEAAVPSMGYQTIDAAAARTVELHDLSAERDTLENEVIRVKFNIDGSIHSIFDKELQKEIIDVGGKANVLAVYHDDGDAWDFPADYAQTKASAMKLTEVKAYLDGPRAIVEQVYAYGKSSLTQKIIVTLASKRVDFETKVDWQEDGKMLRASFPVQVYTDHVNCEIQFGHLKRQTHRNTLWDHAKDEICAHQWIDLSQPDYGVALLNDSKYGFSAQQNVLDIHLLRSPSFPDPTCDRAQHEFVYALLPHKGDFVNAQVYKQGYELNVPLQLIPVATKVGELPNNKSYFVVNSSQVMVEAVKKAEDRESLIIRLYETSGSNATIDFQINLPYERVALVDLMENELEQFVREGASQDAAVQLDFTPFEIKTLEIKLTQKTYLI